MWPFINRKKTIEPLIALVNPDCSEFEVNKFALSQFITENLLSIAGTHPYPLDELLLMTSTVCRMQPTHIFEWGTHIGKSARIFYETINFFNVDSKIYSIDLPDNIEHTEHPKERRGEMVRNIRAVTLIQGDGITESMKIYTEAYKANKKIKPLFFLDGDHSFKSVSRELRIILTNVYNPAILIHDTFLQSKESKYNIGPYKAILDSRKFMKKKQRIIHVALGLPGMTLIY